MFWRLPETNKVPNPLRLGPKLFLRRHNCIKPPAPNSVSGPKKDPTSFPNISQKDPKRPNKDPKRLPRAQNDPKSVDPQSKYLEPSRGGKVYFPPYPPSCWTPSGQDVKKHVKTHTNLTNQRFARVFKPSSTSFGIILWNPSFHSSNPGFQSSNPGFHSSRGSFKTANPNRPYSPFRPRCEP